MTSIRINAQTITATIIETAINIICGRENCTANVQHWHIAI